MKKFLYLTTMFILLVSAGCAISSPETNVSVEWADVVVWNGNTYSFHQEKNKLEKYRDVDKEIGEISFSVAGSKEESNPRYQLKDGEATFAGEGSKIYSLKGLPAEYYILVESKVYVSRE